MKFHSFFSLYCIIMSEPMNEDPFWLQHPIILVDKDRLVEFVMTKDMSLNEKMNSLVRFFIYLAIILAIYERNPYYLLIGLIGFVLTFTIKKLNNEPDKTSEVTRETFEIPKEKDYKKPTINNPFMNASVLDKRDKKALPYPNKTEASKAVKEDIADKFSFNLYENFGDVYNSTASQRQFYTMPAEFTGNDANGEFRKFLVGDMKSFKEDPYQNVPDEPLNRGNTKF